MEHVTPCGTGRAPSATRRAFTLIELLAVIVIIGILVGLMTNAAIKVRARAKVTAIALEVSQLDMAVKEYCNRYGEYPPDFTDLNAAFRHLQKAYPRYTKASDWTAVKGFLNANFPNFDADKLCPATALTFWLAGPDLKGFSANPADPFDTTTTTSRQKPLFEFDSTRTAGLGQLVNNVRYGPYRYFASSQPVPPSSNTDPGVPGYLYFRAPYDATNTGHALSAGGAVTPFVKVNSGGIVEDWVNPATFQILCAGLDSKYQSSTSAAVNYSFPTGAAAPAPTPNPTNLPPGIQYDSGVWDNITNFSAKGTLEDSKP